MPDTQGHYTVNFNPTPYTKYKYKIAKKGSGILWHNFLDIRIWGSDGTGVPNSQFGMLVKIQNIIPRPTSLPYSVFTDILTLSDPPAYIDSLNTSISQGDGNVASAFWGKDNPTWDNRDNGLFSLDKVWMPTKMRATWNGPATINIYTWNTSYDNLTDWHNVTSGTELDITYNTVLNEWDGLYDIPIYQMSIENDTKLDGAYVPFELLTLEAYGNDPSEYWQIGDQAIFDDLT